MRFLDILFIDGDGNDCAQFAFSIVRTGLNIFIRTVTDGEQAIDYLEGRGEYVSRLKHPAPDLVVLDLDMRLSRALAFLEWRKASAFFSFLPVVILSDVAYKGAIEMAFSMGAKSFLSKPFEPEGWEAIVRQIWDMEMERIEMIV